MSCDKCGRIGQWTPRVRYGRLVLTLCRSCYEGYLRALFPDLMPATSRPIDVRSWWMDGR